VKAIKEPAVILSALVVGIQLALAATMPTGSVCENADVAVRPLAVLGVLLGLLAVIVRLTGFRTSSWMRSNRGDRVGSRLRFAALVPLVLPLLSSAWLVIVVVRLRWEGPDCGH
jgi:hypothetical protein